VCARIHLHLHLQGIYADAYTDSDCYSNSYIYADVYSDGNTHRDRDSNSYAYFDTETFTDAEIHANG